MEYIGAESFLEVTEQRAEAGITKSWESSSSPLCVESILVANEAEICTGGFTLGSSLYTSHGNLNEVKEER